MAWLHVACGPGELAVGDPLPLDHCPFSEEVTSFWVTLHSYLSFIKSHMASFPRLPRFLAKPRAPWAVISGSYHILVT